MAMSVKSMVRNLALTVLLISAVVALVEAQGPVSGKPNFLIIITDDQDCSPGYPLFPGIYIPRLPCAVLHVPDGTPGGISSAGILSPAGHPGCLGVFETSLKS